MSFDPATLFSLGQAGAWYDPSDIATLFQDTAGTTPVSAAGQPVARMNDRSGNGKHVTQATVANRPLYQVDGNGKAYLQFDGTDDSLNISAAFSLPFDRISAIQQLSWTLNDQIFGGGGGGGILMQNPSAPQIRLNDGGAGILKTSALAPGTNGVVTERHVAGASKLAINTNAYVGPIDAGSSGLTTLSIGGGGGAVNSNFRLYGMLMRAGAMTDDEIAGLRSWMADKAGVVFSTRRKARHSHWF